MGKTVYKVQVGDEIIEFEGPDNLTEAEIQMAATGKDPTTGEDIPVIVGGSVREPMNESSAIGSFLRSIPKDATFNFADEIAAAANAGIPGLAELDNLLGTAGGEQQGPLNSDLDFWERVRGNMGDFKGQAEADKAAHPTAEFFGRMSGLLASVPRVGAALASRLPLAIKEAAAARPILTAAGLGAAGGAASGAGAGEEGTRGQSAGIGALGGLAVGAGLSAGLELGPAIANYGKIFFNKAGGQEAIAQIVKALKRDGFDVSSPSGVLKLKDALQEYTGKPVSLADIGGATRSRAGVALRAPSEAQQPAIDLLRQRQAGQGQRIARDVRANVAPRSDIHALDEELVNQRRTEAQALRERALFEDAPLPPPEPTATVVPVPSDAPNAGVRRMFGDEVPDTYSREMVPVPEGLPTTGRQSRIVEDPTLQGLARLPDAQRALTGALQRANAERDLLAAQGMDISHIPDLSRGSDLDVRAFDYLKRYLDDEVNMLYKRGQGNTFAAGEAAQVRALRDTIRERLRNTVPEYADYLDQYAGSSKMLDALREGGGFRKLDPEQIAAQQGDRSTAAQELYRVGASRSLLDDILSTKDTSNAASRILNSPESREQLLALGVEPAKAAALNRSIGQERTLNRLTDELAGAQTQQRIAAQADANAGADLAVPFNPGSPYGWAGMVGRTILNRTSVNRNALVNNELLPRLTENNPQIIQGIIAELEAAGKFAEAQLMRRSLRQRQTGLVSGVSIGSPVSIQGE